MGRPIGVGRRLATIVAILVLVVACDGAPSPSPTIGVGAPTPRPSFVAPGSPSSLSPEQIRAEIEPLLGQAAIGLGEGANRVIQVALRANAEAIAHDLIARYGTAVQVTVGLFPYPPPDAPELACRRTPQVVVDHRPLVATIVLQPAAVSGDFIRGKLRFANAGAVPYELITSSTFSVYLFRPGEATPIGASEGGVMGTGYAKTLAPGAILELDAGGGTASCDLAVGYVVPPGIYQARAIVDFQDPQTFENRFFWSEPVTIEVVAP